jgi:G patch domain-containing protein 1
VVDDVEVPIVRTVTDWVPDRLLCKRWNVPDPYVGLVPAAQPPGMRRSRFDRESVADLVGLPSGVPLPAAVPPPLPVAEEAAAVAEPPRPAPDFFKSIFEPEDDEEY